VFHFFFLNKRSMVSSLPRLQADKTTNLLVSA
jgi:hypothetical protein